MRVIGAYVRRSDSRVGRQSVGGEWRRRGAAAGEGGRGIEGGGDAREGWWVSGEGGGGER
jgi:hypothetical protein